MATEKTQTLSNLRTKILQESTNNEGRFVLFLSFPYVYIEIVLACSVTQKQESGVMATMISKIVRNNSLLQSLMWIAKKIGQDGKPLTQPRGIFACPNKTGKTESSYFAKTAYVTIGIKFLQFGSNF